ncbi:MAG: T9SS type A sorting domain-containing protein [Taibaiella sp.]|nr:T9SS type A sorting domain-containing protein [Taibaiella sp.]
MNLRLIYTSALLITGFAATAQYCMLPGRTPYSTDQPGITNFKLNTIDRNSANVESMSKVVVVTTDTTELERGKTYVVSLTHSRDAVIFPTARNNIRIWVDYNNNKSFDDAGETVISKDYKAYGTYVDSFTVPMTAPLGKVRLRATAKMSSDAGHSIPTSCDSPVADPIGYHGEIEDYDVRIIAPPSASVLSPAGTPSAASAFPNPTNGSISLVFDKVTNEPITIDITDITGRHLGRLYEGAHNAALYNFSIEDFTSSTGVYLICIHEPAGTSYIRIVKTD